MYITKKQLAQIIESIEEIKSITSMENTYLGLSESDNNKVKCWAEWFTCYAEKIEAALNGNLDEKYI